MWKFPPRSCGDSRIRFVTLPEMGKVELSSVDGAGNRADGSGGRLRLLAFCSEVIAALAVIGSMFRSAAFLKRNLKNQDSGGCPATQRLQSVRIRHTAN